MIERKETKRRSRKLWIIVVVLWMMIILGAMIRVVGAESANFSLIKNRPQQSVAPTAQEDYSTPSGGYYEEEEEEAPPSPPPPPEYTPPAITITPLSAYSVDGKPNQEALLDAVNKNCQKILEFRDIFQKELQDIKPQSDSNDSVARRVGVLSEQLNSLVYQQCSDFQKRLRRHEATPEVALDVLETIQDKRYGAPWDGYIHSKETVNAEIDALAKIVVENKEKIKKANESSASGNMIPIALSLVAACAIGYFIATKMRKA